MTTYTPTGKPDDVTRYDSRALRREFELIAEGVNSKSDVGSSGTVSTTSMLIESPATKTFTVETGKDFTIGQTVFIADRANPANNMTGLLLSYARDTTGLMSVSVTSHNGSGTKNDWSIGVSTSAGVTLVSNTFTGHQNFARATVASHATTADIWNSGGNQINFTGTAAVTDFPDAPQGGSERVLICAGACSFTASADMEIDGVQSGGVLQCSAKDIVIVRATSNSTFRLSVTRYAGEKGGATTTSSAVDITLTAASGILQNIAMTAANKHVILPDATTVGKGFPISAVKNTGTYPFGVKRNGGTFLCRLNPGQTVVLGCADNSTSAGVWDAFGADLENIYRGNNSEVLNAVDSRVIAVVALSATQAICAFRNNSTTFLNAVVLNFGSASGTPAAVNAEASVDISITALTATRAVVVYKTATGVTKGYVLDVSGNTITPGAVRSIDATAAGSGTSLSALSATAALVGYYDGSGSIQERVLTISGSAGSGAISEGAETLPDATASNNTYLEVVSISATKALYSFRGSSPADIVLRVQTISGSTPTPAGVALRLATTFTDVSAKYSVVVLDANRAVVVQTINGNIEGDILMSLIDISSTTPVLLYNKIVKVGLFSPSGINVSATKLDANHTYVAFIGCTSLGVDSFVLTNTSDDRLLTGPVTEGIELNVNSAAGYLACAALSSSHVMNVCRNSSTYLAAKVTEVSS